MIVSRKMINQWLDLSNISDEEIAVALNSLGFEVEKVKSLIKDNSNLVVGQIIGIEAHPQSDKLTICLVNIGTEILKIICGANNLAVGIKVVVAKITSCLANGMNIVPRVIRGVTSHGMLCAFTEIGLDPDVLTDKEKIGIIHLPEHATVGHSNPFLFLGLDDTIFEIALTINRSDCLSMYQLVQELAHYFRIKLFSKVALLDANITSNDQIDVNSNCLEALASLKIKVNNSDSIKSNYAWKRTLQLAGISSTNFFSDLVNIVMLEIGQPLLLFDGEVIKNFKIYSSAKDYLQAESKIYKNDILFNDHYLTFSNLGYMTLNDYQVTDKTSTIMFVSVNPKIKIMQQQSKKHGKNNSLLLERLMKPVVPDYYLVALQRILYLLKQEGINYQVLEFSNDLSYKHCNTLLRFPIAQINTILGINKSKTEIADYLQKIGCSIKDDKHDYFEVTPPLHRNDLNNVNDYAEEIARLVGYDSIVSKPLLLKAQNEPKNLLQTTLIALRSYLRNNGFHQVKTYSLTSKTKLKLFNFFKMKEPIALLSPISINHEVMRLSLLDSLIDIVAYNQAHKQPPLAIFTDDTIYTVSQNEHYLTFVIPDNYLPNGVNVTKDSFFFYLKGLLFAFFRSQLPATVIDTAILEQVANSAILHPYLNTNLVLDKVHIATYGALNLSFLKANNCSNNLFFAEINCSRLVKLIEKNQTGIMKFSRWSRFNPLVRDLSFLLKKDITFSVLNSAIDNLQVPFLINFKVIDLYEDAKLQSEKKYAITFTFQFNSFYEQLDEEKIKPSCEKISNLLINEFAAVVR